jgi:diketogulonate reductase-like aldo/keto reductase
MVVQNRCFAALGWDKEVRDICQAHGIIYQGFSLLTANRRVLDNPEIRTIAQRLGTRSAQVIFRFAMQIGMLPLTGTTSQQHMKEDLEAEQLALSIEEIQRIETIAPVKHKWRWDRCRWKMLRTRRFFCTSFMRGEYETSERLAKIV